MNKFISFALGVGMAVANDTDENKVYDLDDKIKARLACQIVGEDFLYDLRDLQGDQPYELKVDLQRTIHYNFCKQLGPENYIEDWCFAGIKDTQTYAYLKDETKKECYALTTNSLYPSNTKIENEYHPDELALGYDSDTACPYSEGFKFSISFFFECQDEAEMGSPPTMELVESDSQCAFKVLIFDETGCPVLSMPTFAIFIDQWPWIAAYALIALGAYMLIFGRRHFRRMLRLTIALVVFSAATSLLSINGYVEEKIEEGPSVLTLFMIISILTTAFCVGLLIGHNIPRKVGLVFLCVCNAFVISMLFFSFLMTFTGTWVVLLISCIIMTAVCVYLPLKFEMQMQIQTTSFLGSWMLTRGISLMIGGYPNELQTLTWMNKGYVLSTSNFFFVYFVAIVLLFLIGQRTQRAQFKEDQEQSVVSNSYRRFDTQEEENEDVPVIQTPNVRADQLTPRDDTQVMPQSARENSSPELAPKGVKTAAIQN